MSPELTEALYRDFPNLYKEHSLPMTQTCMNWGFECGPGWEPLIRRLSEKLEPLGVVATQVKEKFGTLRFYFSAPTDEAMDAADQFIDQAEAESATTCEQCGGPGKMSEGYWLCVRCDACNQKEPK